METLSERSRPRTTHLLYLHGFRSSPLSFKAQRLAAWLKEHRPDVQWWCPQLPPSPRQAMHEVRAGIADWPAGHSAVMGSSLGGFYATLVAGHTGWPAVVVNPVVHPARDLAHQIGQQSHWHRPEDSFFFHPAYVAELQALTPRELAHAQRIAAVVATGDEVLNWHEMAERYCHGPVRLVQGSNHALSDFDEHLPFILQHLKLLP
jgi:predicted esterase YcpF (UPF0227 family)